MSGTKKHAPPIGFTIVELLIVIVVIGVLAAITIVAYTGVQVRAQNSQTVSLMNRYVKAVKAYQADNGRLPESDAMTNVYRCFGENYPNNRCGGVGAAAACGFGAISGNTAFDTMIRPYVSNGGRLPTVTADPLNCPEGPIAGAVYVWRNETQVANIYYFLKGDAACQNIAGVFTSKSAYATGLTRCSMTIE